MNPARTIDALTAALDEAGMDYARKSSGGAKSEHFVLELPGERKLKTTVLLTAGGHGVRVEAFVCRRPDENFEAVYKWLLKRNRRLYGIAYTLDNIGDIYLVGRISVDALTVAEVGNTGVNEEDAESRHAGAEGLVVPGSFFDELPEEFTKHFR